MTVTTSTRKTPNSQGDSTLPKPTVRHPASTRASLLGRAAWKHLDRYEEELAAYLAGELDEETFRICRLNNGVYGQRQGEPNQMIRVKVPYGSLNAEQLEILADIAEVYSRGWGHITTRQNIQFHFVDLKKTPTVLRELAEVGLTTREAGGDTVRNISACPLAGVCPFELFDVSPWAEAAFQHLLHHPYGQRLPRKFKINFSGCMKDCGQAIFNDVGVIAAKQESGDGRVEYGFRILLGGGLGANPHRAVLLEEFTPRESLLPTIEAVVRVFDHYGNRDNKVRSRLKWLVDAMGSEELKQRILKERKLLRGSSSWPGGIPAVVAQHGDGVPGDGDNSDLVAPTPVSIRTKGIPAAIQIGSDLDNKGGGDSEHLDNDPYHAWLATNVLVSKDGTTVSAIAHAELGDVTAAQFRTIAKAQRELGADVRVTNRQDVVFRGLSLEALPRLYRYLEDAGMAGPNAGLARDVVSCPGADTCNLAVTQSRGMAKAVAEALEEAGLGGVDGIRINISGCTNSCGQHHIADIGLYGVERRVHGRSAPGYQLVLGGGVDEAGVSFATKALKLPAKKAARAVVHIVQRYALEREAEESFASFLARAGGASAIAAELKYLDVFEDPEENPDLYIDFGETGPYVAEVGIGECAGA